MHFNIRVLLSMMTLTFGVQAAKITSSIIVKNISHNDLVQAIQPWRSKILHVRVKSTQADDAALCVELAFHGNKINPFKVIDFMKKDFTTKGGVIVDSEVCYDSPIN